MVAGGTLPCGCGQGQPIHHPDAGLFPAFHFMGCDRGCSAGGHLSTVVKFYLWTHALCVCIGMPVLWALPSIVGVVYY